MAVFETLYGTDADQDDELFVSSEGFLRPATLSRGEAGNASTEALKQGPAFFDASGLAVRHRYRGGAAVRWTDTSRSSR